MAPAEPATSRPRVLIPITLNFGVRYVVRTGLHERLRQYCQPVLGLTWDDPTLAADLRAGGAEVVRIPDPQVGPEVRLTLTLLRAAFEDRLASPSTAIDRARYATTFPPTTRAKRRLQWLRTRVEARRSGAAEAAEARLLAQLDEGTNLAENIDLLRASRIDAVLSITPYVPQELVLLHAVRRLGLPACTSILSFDNLTTRPPLPIPFERYLVWNAFMVDELLRSHPGVRPEQVAVVGAGQFDVYGDDAYREDEQDWLDRLRLAAGHPTLLFGGGPTSIAPHETQYLDHLLQGIEDGRLPSDLQVVLRRHPNDAPERWERFRSNAAVHFDDPGDPATSARRPHEVDMGASQIIGLRSSLIHTDVHVNVSSTMTLDGAFFDKPQIGPAYDVVGTRRHDRDARDLYGREHFIPIVGSGGLELATSPDHLVALTAQALADPARLVAERRRMVEAMCTFTDGGAAARIAEELRPLLSAPAPAGPA